MSVAPRTSLLEAKKKEWAAQADMSLSVNTPSTPLLLTFAHDSLSPSLLLSLSRRSAATSTTYPTPNTRSSLLRLKRVLSAPVLTSNPPPSSHPHYNTHYCSTPSPVVSFAHVFPKGRMFVQICARIWTFNSAGLLGVPLLTVQWWQHAETTASLMAGVELCLCCSAFGI